MMAERRADHRRKRVATGLRSSPLPEFQQTLILAGFTLVEIAVVLSIIAMITAMSISMGSSMVTSAKIANTNNKLNEIEAALMAFRMTNNRLPCPTDPTLTESSSSFGYEAGYTVANNPTGSCTGGTPAASPTYTLSTPGSNTNLAGGSIVSEGAVPVRTLNLPNEFQVDGWGRKFGYAVWNPATTTNAFLTYSVTPSCGGITIENAAHSNRSTAAVYALISYGADGHGGYLIGGGRYSAGASDSDEQKNCHCDSNASNAGYAPGYTATYIQKDMTWTSATSTFDDYVRFKERWQMANDYDKYKPIGPQCASGFATTGSAASIESGYSVAIGDINGDGIPDLIIGAPYTTIGGNSNSGSVYVVFGTPYGFPDPLPLSSLNGTNGFELDGAAASNNVGYSVAVGDFNGDGVKDLIIGAPGTSAGSVYIVYGSTSAWTSPQTLNTGAGTIINGVKGIRLDGVTAGDKAGSAVAAGDVNGDGYTDVIIGAPVRTTSTGSVYAVFGAANVSGTPTMKDGTHNWASTQTLSGTVINSTNGVVFNGVSSGDQAGFSLATGDINGNGTVDFIVGAPYRTTNTGATYLVFGASSWTSPVALSGLNGTTGVIFNGASTNIYSGYALATGDVNGDGTTDLLIGAYGATIGANANAGATYIVFGSTSTWTSPHTLNAAYLTGSSVGVEFDGNAASIKSGYALATGDLNNDGIADFIIGAPDATISGNANAGSVYVVFGAKTGWSGTATLLNSSLLNGTTGAELDGASANNYAGSALATGNISGDGIADLVIGAYGATVGVNANAGTTYTYFGKSSGWSSDTSLGGL
jgi:type II secretory pathway pseudopilin PulG